MKHTRKRYRRKRTIKRVRHIGGNKSTAVVFTLNSDIGFGSVFLHLCKAYIYSEKNGYDFYITDNNWKYKYEKGWHDYFNSLNVYDSSQKYSTVKEYGHSNLINIPDYTLEDYHKCIKKIFVLNQNLIDLSNEFIKKIGGDYVSIYIRRGDKHLENARPSVSSILEQYHIKDDGKNIYIQTDDYSTVKEITKLLPTCKIYTLTPDNSRGAIESSVGSLIPDERKKNSEELFMSIIIFIKGVKCYSDGTSNIGRLHKIMGLEKVNLYPINNKPTLATVIVPYNKL